MSRRFGRNQRRRMREQLAAQEAEGQRWQDAYHREVGLLHHVREKKRDLEETLQAIYALVGPWSIVAPPHPVELQPGMTSIRLPVPDQPAAASMKAVQPFEILHAVEVAASREEFRRLMHLQLSCRGEKVRYSISEEALYRPSEAIRAFVTRQLAPQLVEALLEQVRCRG